MSQNLVDSFMKFGAGGGTSQLYGSHGYEFGNGSLDTAEISVKELATTTTGTILGDLAQERTRSGNAQTETIIYTLGGALTTTLYTNIEEFEVGVDTDASAIADLNTAVQTNGNKGFSETHAFVLGGGTGGWGYTSEIQSYEFGSGTTATAIADLDTGVFGNAGGTNLVYSYSYVGFSGSRQTWIQEYENGTGTDATTVADSVTARYGMNASSQDSTHIIGFGGDA
jgi:hypothetical protein